MVDRRKLIAVHLLLTAVGAVLAATAHRPWVLFVGLGVAGLFAVVVQTTVAYTAALAEILADLSNDLLVVELDGALVGTLQLTLIPGMARRCAKRLLVEAVRVRSDLRSAGIGSAAMRWVGDAAAPALGAALVQLTSDAARTDAHRFYERLGYAASPVGIKLRVPRD